MHGNSFETRDGGHVGGAVAMALDKKGKAVPIDENTPIGKVKLDGLFTLEQFCRALAVHAMLINGKQGGGVAEEYAGAILAFAIAGKDTP